VKRLTLIGVIAGALFILVGLVTIGSTVGQDEPTETRSAAMLIMSFGGMMIAIPLYVEARQSTQTEKKAAASQSDSRLRCFVCGKSTAALRCEKHKARLCLDCLSRHDEAQCFYVPLSRFQKTG
jgi:cytochrome c biogenesis protein CcdA